MSTARHMKALLTVLDKIEAARVQVSGAMSIFKSDCLRILMTGGGDRTTAFLIEDARLRLVRTLETLVTRYDHETAKHIDHYLHTAEKIARPDIDQHQPGPWALKPTEVEDDWAFTPAVFVDRDAKNVAGVCVIVGPGMTDQSAANVKLAGSGPTLLLALRRAVLQIARLEAASSVGAVIAAFAGNDPLLDDLEKVLDLWGGLCPEPKAPEGGGT